MAVLAELLHAPLTQIFLRQNITKLAKNLLKKLNLKKKMPNFCFFLPINLQKTNKQKYLVLDLCIDRQLFITAKYHINSIMGPII